MSKTPTKVHTDTNFTPREITTPNKDHPGISKTVFSHVSNLHTLLTDWAKMLDKGLRICRAVGALKLHECNDDYYPQQLKPLMDSLLESLGSLKNVLESVQIINGQLEALARLQPTQQPVISTWSASQISETVNEIHKCLEKEYKLKQTVTENVAHCRDEKLIEVYLSAWELEPYFNIDSYMYLFAEVGLAGIT